MKKQIVLATLNARYIHTAFGLRYLKANLGEYEQRTRICEFTLEQRPLDIVEQILAFEPQVVGLGVYVWNAEQSFKVAGLIKEIVPHVKLILGGPEVSYEQDSQAICKLADYVISGPGEVAMYRLCQGLIDKQSFDDMESLTQPKLSDLKLPYYLYDDDDLAHRVLYVEASRGCPFKCEFCLSALDKTAYAFPLDQFLDELKRLYDRGARHFKFVDRTFNLSGRISHPILKFFLDRIPDDPEQNEVFLHFEVIPDRLPETLKSLITQFPHGSLQFEVGVQTFNPRVQAIIQRKQDNEKSCENLAWLSQHSGAHIHADLIFGLPGETLESMEQSFNKLYMLGPDEIQLGTLKRLRGMPLVEHVDEYQMLFNPSPPYEILSTREVDFFTMQRLRRMARYWDLVANSGRFRETLPSLLRNSPFARFMKLSDWLYARTGQTHKISLMRLFDLLFEALTIEFTLQQEAALGILKQDFARSGLKGLPQCMRSAGHKAVTVGRKKGCNRRQQAHSS